MTNYGKPQNIRQNKTNPKEVILLTKKKSTKFLKLLTKAA